MPIRKKCCSQDMCFSFGIGKDIDFQRGYKELSSVLNSLARLGFTGFMGFRAHRPSGFEP